MDLPLNREPAQGFDVTESPHMEALLDNIRSAWNVGSMFRTADGLGIRRLHLCGLTPTPENPKVVKTSLGGEKKVAWRQYNDGVKAARELREQGFHLWALEDCPQAEVLTDIGPYTSRGPLLLVVGNEISGVDPGILELCERVLSIPMRGVKRSFNAAVAFGIAAYHLSISI
jgi:tRNA G18 (ribose-2'-O)-methylase SpoU